MDKREENARMLDPDRFKIAKDMSYMPGGPMMNNPMNVVNHSSTGKYGRRKSVALR